MTNSELSARGALLLAAVTVLSACEAPADDGLAAPSGDEQAALAKAEAMIEENRERLATEGAAVEETGSEE